MGQLSPKKPIEGWFSIVSPKNKTVGELEISARLEPLLLEPEAKVKLSSSDSSLNTGNDFSTLQSLSEAKGDPRGLVSCSHLGISESGKSTETHDVQVS
jgi:hypothetical protein